MSAPVSPRMRPAPARKRPQAVPPPGSRAAERAARRAAKLERSPSSTPTGAASTRAARPGATASAGAARTGARQQGARVLRLLARPVAAPLARRRRRRAIAGPRPALPLPFVGVVAAVWAGATSLLAVLVCTILGWAMLGRGDFNTPVGLRTGALAWLMAHGTALDLTTARSPAAGRIVLLPLGITLLVLVLLWRCGRWAARAGGARGLLDAAVVVASAAVAYALLVAVVAGVVSQPGQHPVPGTGAIVGLLLATLGIGSGVLTETGLGGVLLLVTPTRYRAMLVGGGAGLATCLGTGGLLVAVAAVLSREQISALVRATAPGATDGITLALASIVLAPTAVVWAACLLVGPGFGIGAGTTVTVGGNVFGPVPAFPLLGLLPSGPTMPHWLVLASGAAWLLVSGVVAVVALRGCWDEPLAERALRAGAAGALAGLGLAVLSLASAASLGTGRLAVVGPRPLLVAVVCAGWFAVSAAGWSVLGSVVPVLGPWLRGTRLGRTWRSSRRVARAGLAYRRAKRVSRRLTPRRLFARKRLARSARLAPGEAGLDASRRGATEQAGTEVAGLGGAESSAWTATLIVDPLQAGAPELDRPPSGDGTADRIGTKSGERRDDQVARGA